MKNALILGSIALTLTRACALAGDGWSMTLEPEHEYVKGDPSFNSDSLALIGAYRQGANKYDLKLETSKDHIEGASVGTKIEVRYRRYFGEFAGIEPSLRVSIGNKSEGDLSYGYYTFQPKFSYDLHNGWEPYVSVRYRNAFDRSKKWETTTTYLGAAYDLGQGWEVEPSLFHKNGDDKSNGIKLEITKAFN